MYLEQETALAILVIITTDKSMTAVELDEDELDEDELADVPADVRIKHLKERPSKMKKLRTPERDLKIKTPERGMNLSER